MAVGDHIVTTKPDHVCFLGVAPVLTCSSTTGLMASNAYPKLACQVCSAPIVGSDTDDRKNRFAATLTFGPNQVSTEGVSTGDINETIVDSYKVYWLHSNGFTKMEPELATVTKKATPLTCCSHDYSVSISAMIPMGAKYLTVLPVFTGGIEAPYGARTVAITDDAKRTEAPTPAPTPAPKGPSPTPAPTPAPAAVQETRVSGQMDMTVPDPSAFANDQNVKTGLANGFAEAAGVPAQYVTVRIEVVTTRRLEDRSESRFLQSSSGTVRIFYDIIVPASASLSVTPSQMTSNLAAKDATAMTTLINNKVAAATGGNTFSGTVTSFPSPTVTVVTVPPTPAPTPAPTPPAGTVEGGASPSAVPLASMALLAMVVAAMGFA